MRAGVAIGSNLGDRLAAMQNARAAVGLIEGVSGPVVSSSIYETEPVDCEMNAGKFFNAVLEFEYSADPETLLRDLRAIEHAHGRPEQHARNRSRALDLDLLYFGHMTLATDTLQIPHPRMIGRRFVLAPLAEIRPDLVLPGESLTVSGLLDRLPPGGAVTRQNLTW